MKTEDRYLLVKAEEFLEKYCENQTCCENCDLGYYGVDDRYSKCPIKVIKKTLSKTTTKSN